MMVVNNPESPRSPRHSFAPQTEAQRRQEAQERRWRLGEAYTAAVTGYPRGTGECVYALPARYSTTTARIDDPILARTYSSIVELRRRLAIRAERAAAAHDLAVLVGRMWPGQRRYLAQQMLAQEKPQDAAVCGVCWDTFETGQRATSIPCGHSFHQPCIQTAFENASTCTCPVCKRDVSLGALLHDPMQQGGKDGVDPDALWKSLSVDNAQVDAGERPMTPPMGGAAPPLANVKESWRVKLNAAYDINRDSKAAKDRAWQLDTALRRLGYSVPTTLRDRASSLYDISRLLQNAGWTEQARRAMAYLEQQRVSASSRETEETEEAGEEAPKPRCPVCEVPLQAADTAAPPCGHKVHMGCWTIWFDKHKHTRCPTCTREIAVYACMAGTLAEPKDLGTVKELWLTSEEVYFQ